MKIKQSADCAISIRRFDNGEQLDFVKDTIIDNIDAGTGAHLLQMKIKDDDGVLQTDFVEVE